MSTPIRKPFAISEYAFESPQMSFRHELRQVLQERNLLTAKSRKRVCTLLDNSVSSPNKEGDKRRQFRMQAIEEILTSEKAYLNQLRMLMDFFVRPLKEQAIIDDNSHTSLFGQIEMIYNLNGEFFRELETNIEDVGKAFLKMAPFFKLYSVYAFDYKNALLILQELTSKNPVFRKFLEQTESLPLIQRKLNSLLIVPIQRVPRYKLLLEQVLLYTSPADADYKTLKESVTQIASTVSHINSCIEDQEVTQMLINLQNSLTNRTPSIVKPSRKVIREGILRKVTRTGAQIPRYCVLMSDIFMYCKILKDRPPNTIVENSLECCCIFPLKKCKVNELFPGNFKVTCQGDGIILCADTLQSGQAWVGFIRDAIDLHVECRRTLRKESSKRTPLRKKDLKKFEIDYVSSPSQRKYDYETVFRNENCESDSENHSDNETFGCFSRKKQGPPISLVERKTEDATAPRKRRAPEPPTQSTAVTTKDTEKNFEEGNASGSLCFKPKLLKLKLNETKISMKSSKSYIRDEVSSSELFSGYAKVASRSQLQDVEGPIEHSIVPGDASEAVGGNEFGGGSFRDVLFPLRSSNGSNKGEKQWLTPYDAERDQYEVIPQKKRVKFNDLNSYVTVTPNVVRSEPFKFNAVRSITGKRASLREKIYQFFRKLF